MSKQMAKGSSYERMVADYIRTETGQPADRRVKTGTKDKGDLMGVTFLGQDVCVECKNRRAMQLSVWVDEAEAERANAKAALGVVIHHRKGCGAKRLGKSYATMELDSLLDMMRWGDELLGRLRAAEAKAEVLEGMVAR